MAVVSAADRLRAAILASVLPGSHGQLCGTTYGSECDCFIQDRVDATMERIWAADLTLEQDIADGQSLRLLAAAMGEGQDCETVMMQGGVWEVAVYDGGDVIALFTEPTIAEAAEACRKALAS